MSRALYLSDNEFEHLSPEIKNMKNLRILALRDNELVDIPQVGSASGLVWAGESPEVGWGLLSTTSQLSPPEA